MKPEILPHHDRSFVDAFTGFGMAIGLPRSSARVLAYLLVCTPHEQTAEQLRTKLDLSSGSTSIATAMLIEMGLAEVVRKPRQRQFYYQLIPDGFVAITRRRTETFSTATAIADIGLGHNPTNERLIAMRDLYVFLGKEMKEIMSRFDQKT